MRFMRNTVKCLKLCSPVLVGSLVASFMGSTEVSAQSRSQHNFDDWQVVCLATDAETPRRCHMLQTLVQEQNRRQLFQWTIVPDDENQLTSVLSAPLGVLLPPGVEVSVEGREEPITVEYNLCNRRWCHARQPLSEDFIIEMAAGDPVAIVYVNQRGQRLRMEATMRGFGDALEFMRTQNEN